MEPDPHDADPRGSVHERRRIDVEILLELDAGRCTPRYLARELDHQQPYVSQRLRDLVDDGLVERIDRGLYELDCEVDLNE